VEIWRRQEEALRLSPLYDPGAGSMALDSRPLASFVRHELASLRIARNCFKRPALI
jgi:hypothetical protein